MSNGDLIQKILLVTFVVISISCRQANCANKTEKRAICTTCSYTGQTYRSYADGNTLQRILYEDVASYGCAGNPCGVNAVCQETSGGRPVCSCPPGYTGHPLSHCNRGECLDNVDCRSDLQCKDGRCVNPCLGACGLKANCEPKNHVAVCSCPAGYKGDPFTSCRPIDPDEQCHPSPCGANTKCQVINAAATCSCLPGYIGNPLSGCRHECEYDGDCSSRDMCSNYKCVPACQQCGIGATCNSVSNHRALCECPKGYYGSPYTQCHPECYGDADCPSNRPACFYGVCKNTCDGACGVGANCHLRGLTPICSCPRDMTGNPFVRCRPFTKEDLCEPNPCGKNALCIPGHDNTGRERPVCNCLPGYTGNPLSYCTRGECLSNNECPDNKACINYRCVNPCIGKCAPEASCEPKAHLAVCKCPNGYNGDALVSCRAAKSHPIIKHYTNCLTCKK